MRDSDHRFTAAEVERLLAVRENEVTDAPVAYMTVLEQNFQPLD